MSSSDQTDGSQELQNQSLCPGDDSEDMLGTLTGEKTSSQTWSVCGRTDLGFLLFRLKAISLTA